MLNYHLGASGFFAYAYAEIDGNGQRAAARCHFPPRHLLLIACSATLDSLNAHDAISAVTERMDRSLDAGKE